MSDGVVTIERELIDARRAELLAEAKRGRTHTLVEFNRLGRLIGAEPLNPKDLKGDS